MKVNFKRVGTVAMGLGAALLPALAMAEPTAPTITPPDLDYTVLGTMVGSILAGLAFMWVVRKAIKTMNKS